MDINQVTQFLESRILSDFLLPWKILAVIASIFLLYAINYYFNKQQVVIADAKRRFKDFFNFQKFYPPRSFLNRAKEVSVLLDRKNYKKAVLKSEALFYALLKHFGYEGNSLKQILEGDKGNNIPNIDDMKKMAAMAESIRQDSSYVVKVEDIKDIFDSFEDTLRKMDVLIDDND